MSKKDTACDEAEVALGEVGGQLKAMFDKVADQPIPEHLIELVDALEEKRRHQQKLDEEF